MVIRPLTDILLDTLQQLEQSGDTQLGDPAVSKLREEISGMIVKLQIVKSSSDSQEPAPIPIAADPKAA